MLMEIQGDVLQSAAAHLAASDIPMPTNDALNEAGASAFVGIAGGRKIAAEIPARY